MWDFLSEERHNLEEYTLEKACRKCAYELALAYNQRKNKSELEAMMRDPMQSMLEYVYEFPKSVSPMKAKRYCYSDLAEKLDNGLFNVQMKVNTRDVGYWDSFIKDLTFDYQGKTCHSEQFENVVSLNNAVIEMLSEFWGLDKDSNLATVLERKLSKILPSQTSATRSRSPKKVSSVTYHVVKEADLWGGNPNSTESIKTFLSIHPTQKVPAKPKTHYKDKIRNLLKKANKEELEPEDIKALDWCVKDWVGLARHYFANDKDKRILGEYMLEALVYEYEVGFAEAFLKNILKKESAFAKELREDLNMAAEDFLANLDAYSYNELINLVNRFQWANHYTTGGVINKLSPIVQAINDFIDQYKADYRREQGQSDD